MDIVYSKLIRSKPFDQQQDTEAEDRFSGLPDSVAHHVFSFLTNIEDIARLRFTSKRCKHLCLSIPSLIIDASHFSAILAAGSARKLRFMDLLVSLISHRRAELKSLTILWSSVSTSSTETCRIMSMLYSAIQCHVSELDFTLRIESGEVFAIPLDIFYCESLRSLKVNLNAGLLQLPCPCGFSHLKTLHIKNVETSYEDIGEWISSFCKFLKKLHVEELSGICKFKLSTSSLESIEIRNCELRHLDISAQSLKAIIIVAPFISSSVRTSLNIYAPNVRVLTLHSYFSSYYSLGKMDLLDSVSLSLYDSVYKNNSSSLLRSIAQTQNLSISCNSIMRMYEGYYGPFIFNKLQSLKLFHRGLSSLVAHSMTVFIQEIQLGLKSLHIKRVPGHKDEQYCLYCTSTSVLGAKFWKLENILFIRASALV